jgi:RHS repeat-associated protein
MAVNIGKLNQPQLYNYGYDQLNRIVSMDVYRGLNQDSNSWSNMPDTSVHEYRERVAYDANGNILKYLRNGSGGTVAMDSLTYHYYAGTNRLSHVNDKIDSTFYTEDIDNQIPETYGYDEIGNLVKDTSSRKMKVTWNVYGKIMGIIQSDPADGETVGITYKYDPNGNRVGKYVHRHLAPFEHHWYVRDAQGNVMAVYKHAYGPSDWSLKPLKLVEHHVYGSSRLGIVRRDLDVTSILNPKKTPVTEDLIGNTYVYTAERGGKLYELTNHLGNVLVTVTDKKNGVPSSGNSSLIDHYTADVVSASDYYPFGMLMPGRKFESGEYRYGFNGKENDDELKGEGNQQDYGFRIYDPRLGKFLSVDPLAPDYPELTTYQFASNSPIAHIDLDGLEKYYYSGAYVVHDNIPRVVHVGVINAHTHTPASVVLPAQARADMLSAPRTHPRGRREVVSTDRDPKWVKDQAERIKEDLAYHRSINRSVMDPLALQMTLPLTMTARQMVRSPIEHSIGIYEGIKDGNGWKIAGNSLGLALDMSPLLIKGAGASVSSKTDEFVTIYRTIDAAEATSIINSGGKFSFGPNGSTMKQFWLSEEAYEAYIKAGGGGFANGYKLQVQVPKSLIGENKVLNTSVQVDDYLFPPNTTNSVTVQGQQGLDKLNSAAKNIKVTRE